MKSLSQLLFFEPGSKEYDEFEKRLSDAVSTRYEGLEFELYKEEKESESDIPSLIVFTIDKDSSEFSELFNRAVTHNLDYKQLKKNFVADVLIGGVIPLGNDVVVLEEETGVSVPSSGQPIKVNISFQSKDNYDKFHKEDQEDSGE